MGKLRVVTVVGARPQFIKAAPVSQALRQGGLEEILIHTGQHYDDRLSDIFFRELDIPEPQYNLAVGSGSHGWQTGQMLIRLEEALTTVRPDAVFVYGDTNSTLAAALAAVKLHIPLHHVEAGLRSFNRAMPEEHNRVLTDHCSDGLYCPTSRAVTNLQAEGITRGVHQVGDPMLDALMRFLPLARCESAIMERLNLTPKEYGVATIHRPYNTDEPERLVGALRALGSLEQIVVFPVHPRTRAAVDGILRDCPQRYGNLRVIEPLGYLDALRLQENARFILTDSGGMQKEAYMLGVPCLTLRPETEWVETIESGWNVLVEPDQAQIASAVSRIDPRRARPQLYGDGRASEKIVAALEQELGCGLPLVNR